MVKSTSWRAAGMVGLGISLLVSSVSANHSWGDPAYHWARTRNPFTLKVGDNVSSAWDPYLSTAINDWTASTVLNLTAVAGRTKPRQCRPTAGQIEVCSDRYGFNGWLGIAQIWITGGQHISQATTKVNDSYFETSTYNTPAWRRFVMCQEIGHDFGLDHQDEAFNNANLGSCMDYTNDPDGPPSNEHPNKHDFDQLGLIYGHLDSTTTVGAALPKDLPPAMNQIAFDTPGQWGRLVRSTRNRRAQVYELDFGRGNKVVTRVLWADPQADAQ